MLIGGYMGEAGYMDATPAFVIGMAGWIYIIYEIFKDVAKINASSGNASSQFAFKTIRNIVTFGWATILGYFLGYIQGDGPMAQITLLTSTSSTTSLIWSIKRLAWRFG